MYLFFVPAILYVPFFNRPAEYFPMSQLRHQLEVNFFGYYAVAQAFLPLLKAASSVPGARRGRLIFVGTGGGVPSACPPLLRYRLLHSLGLHNFSALVKLP
jgi:NAD(P)-dependent dehydrogenase (short-subunit alcohol dehydrogenase family)